MRYTWFPALILILVSASVFAQNTGGVFSPVVNEGHKSIQYRLAANPSNEDGETDFAQRLHYQQSLNDDFRLRIVGQVRKTVESNYDYDFTQLELSWDLGEDTQTYRTGFRLDLRRRDEDRPDQIGIHWMNQFKFQNQWRARAVVLSTTQVGDDAADGVNLQTRWQLAKRYESGHTFGVDMYNAYGNTEDIAEFNDQVHTIGPIWILPIMSEWTVFSGILVGLTDASPDTDIRVWIGRSF